MSDPATFVPATTWQNLSSGGVQVTPILSVPNATYLAPAGGQNGLTGTTNGELIWLRGTATALDGGQQFLMWDELSVDPASGTTVFNPWAVTGTPGRWKAGAIVTLPGLLTNGVIYYNGTAFTTNAALTYDLTQLSLNGRLLVNRNGAVIDDQDATSPVRVAAADGHNTYEWLYSAGVGVASGVFGMMARGTLAAPTATQDGDALLRLSGGGFGATQWKADAGSVTIHALGNWTDTQQGTRTVISTVAQAGALPKVARVDVRQGVMLNSGAGTAPTGGDPGPGSLNLFGTLQFNGTPIAGNVPATATNDNAVAGNVGQLVESDLLVANQVALVSGVAKTVTSIALTAGDWDVWGTVATNPAGTTTQTSLVAGISLTTNVQPTSVGKGGLTQIFTSFQVGIAIILPTGTTRISLAAPATVFLVATSNFGASTNNAYGYIGARRRR